MQRAADGAGGALAIEPVGNLVGFAVELENRVQLVVEGGDAFAVSLHERDRRQLAPCELAREVRDRELGELGTWQTGQADTFGDRLAQRKPRWRRRGVRLGLLARATAARCEHGYGAGT